MARICNVCGNEDHAGRWDLETCLDWIGDSMRWRGEVLHGEHIHWCVEWDGLPVDETTDEHAVCGCFKENAATG